MLASGAKAGARFVLDRALVVGTGNVDIQISDDPTLSGRHARFSPTRHGAVVTDLGSTNGTFVAGQRIGGDVKIGDGEVVRLGATQIKLRVE